MGTVRAVRRGALAAAVAVGLLGAALSSPPAHAEVFDVPGRYREVVFLPEQVVQVENLQYGRAVNWQGQWQDLLLDVHYVPTDGAAWRPAIVWVHGGFFLRGSKDSYQDSIAEFARAGYVVFSINYRLQGGDFPEGLSPDLFIPEVRIDDYLGAITQAQHDAQAAIRWVRLHAAEYLVDPNRVGIAGHSAGGLTATAVAFNADDDPGNSGSPGPSSIPNAAIASAGAGLPLRQLHIDNGDTPILFTHGLVDTIVPYTIPMLCVPTIALGNVCEQVIDPDQDHGIFGYPEMRDFLYRFLVDRPGLILPTNLTVVGIPGLE